MFNLVRKSVTTPEGKHYTNYFLQLENGAYIAIRPAFNNDYKTLYVLAVEEKKEKE